MKKIQLKLVELLGNADLIFFYLFLLTFTLSVRKVLYYFPVKNTFNEYQGIYLYLSDIFLIITLICWLIMTLCNKTLLLSICNNYFNCSTWNKKLLKRYYHSLNKKEDLFNVPRGTLNLFKESYSQVIHSYATFFPLVMVFFSFFSILWATNKPLATYNSLKLLELVFLYFYVKHCFVPRGTKQLFNSSAINSKININHCFTWNNWNIFSWIIIFVSTAQSAIAIIQQLLNHSIGLFFLKESHISPIIPGVAKVILNGKVHIRAYGLFPHPNILGGFLLFSIIFNLYYMFHVEQFNLLSCFKAKNKKYLFILLFTIQFAALLLTFSKSAIIGLLISLAILTSNKYSVPRGTISKKVIIILLIILFSLLIALKPNYYSLFIKTLQERGFYTNVSRETIMSHPFIGIGAGQFIPNMISYYDLPDWQYQPVHNVFLLIISQFGIVIGILFAVYIIKLVINCSTWNNLDKTGDNNLSKSSLTKFIFCDIVFKSKFLLAIIAGYIFIMIFDHYFWDIQQGQLILWLVFGLISA